MPRAPAAPRRLAAARRRVVAGTIVVVATAVAACGADAGDIAGRDGEPPNSAVPAELGTTVPDVAEGPEGPAFYQPPDPLAPGPPGELIWARTGTDADGATEHLVLYHSVAVDGRDVAVSGAVYVPDGAPPDGGWPIYSWGHGTTGLGDDCAPSRRGASDSVAWFDDLIERGFVVAATDYEGLGTPGEHPYVVGESEGRGMLDAARAAQALLVSAASDRVVLGGHSQGGGAAVLAAELVADYAPELDVVGTVAGAPAAELVALARTLAEGPFAAFTAMAASGFVAAYPDLVLEEVVTPEVVAELPAIRPLCVVEIVARFVDRGDAAVLVADPGTVAPWAARLEANSPGNRPADAPVFVFHGETDDQIPPVISEAMLARYCRFGGAVERRVYPGAGHIDVLSDVRDDALAWIDDRLAGKDPPTAC